jgi:hypoxanthine phosphoribosyltransferase
VDIAGRDVIIVEDVVDSGLTLNYLLANLGARGPASLAICTLLHKVGLQETAVPLKYVGFEIADDFVVGYGIDVAERYRNLESIFSFLG